MSQLLVAQRALTVPGWAKDALWRRAQAIPSLDLRFADNKSLVDAVTGASLVTFTRASSGTFVDSAGVIQTAVTDVPRFDHNPTTGESLGLLVEEQRTNLKTHSEAILTANGYGATNATLAAASIANPFGGTTASLFTLNAGANTGNNTDGFSFGNAITLTNSTAHAQSLFVKPAGATVLRLRSNVGGALFDFTLTGNGTAPSPSSDLQSASIVPFRDGWYRVSWTFTSTTTAPGNRGDYWTIKTNVADGTNGLYVVGAQLEAGAFPTSYIPTTATAATRSADVATDTTRGAALRTLYAQFRSPASGTRPVVSLDDNTANERIEILTSGTDPKLLVTDGGSAVADIDAGAITANITARLGARFTTDNFAASISGGAEVLDATGTMPTVDRIRVGSNQAGGYLNGTIARIAGWDAPLVLLPTITQ